MKIIVIDDETAPLGNFLSHIVDEEGIEYKMFRNSPLEAVEYIKTNQVHAAFLDIKMPEINGVVLAERLIAVNKNILIVFISGYAQDEADIARRLGSNLLGFCYKPYDKETLFKFLNSAHKRSGGNRKLSIIMFGGFNLFINNTAVKFSSSKSKELLALLADKNGGYLSMSEIITAIWPDKNIEFAKKLYRDAVWRLRHTLNEYSASPLVNFEWAKLSINKECASCDYWDFLAGINTEKYTGSYLPSYEWSMETQIFLDGLKLT